MTGALTLKPKDSGLLTLHFERLSHPSHVEQMDLRVLYLMPDRRISQPISHCSLDHILVLYIEQVDGS